MNSYQHSVSSSRKWGGKPEDYQPIHEFIDSSKMTLGDVRHRALCHHTQGIYLCQKLFGDTLTIQKDKGSVEVPVRLIAERHILEDLGWIPTPADWLKNTPIETWMSGSRIKEVPLAQLLRERESVNPKPSFNMILDGGNKHRQFTGIPSPEPAPFTYNPIEGFVPNTTKENENE